MGGSNKGTRKLGLLAAAVGSALAVTAMPAQAQWGGLLNNLLQQGQQAMQRKQQQQAAEEARLGPRKKWGAAKTIPAALQAQAKSFADVQEPPELRPLFERLYIEGERNATLNLQRIGLAALALNKLDLAEKSLDAAAFRIDLIYADNPEAQKAKSLWNAEKVKDFKGEPYERAMTYFYRGLVYAARGDYQNARAMFKQADYQDTVAEQEQYAGDFALMPYMAGWASFCDGDKNMAQDFLKQAIKGDTKYEGVPIEQPVLVLFETGRTPFKYGTGRYDEVLKWQPHQVPEQTVASASAADKAFVEKFIVGADIAYQATTRGGRPVDGIMNGKAQFKSGADTVAKVGGAVALGSVAVGNMTGSDSANSLGIAASLLSLGAMGVSAATQTQADIREWEMLPSTIWLGGSTTMQTAAVGTVSVTTVGETAASNMAVNRLGGENPKCQIYWGRSLAPTELMSFAGPVEPGAHPRDPAFRAEMMERFPQPQTQQQAQPQAQPEPQPQKPQ